MRGRDRRIEQACKKSAGRGGQGQALSLIWSDTVRGRRGPCHLAFAPFARRRLTAGRRPDPSLSLTSVRTVFCHLIPAADLKGIPPCRSTKKPASSSKPPR